MDEADSVLIDEAKTPLFITKTIENEDKHICYAELLLLASKLQKNQNYAVNDKQRYIEITSKCKENLDKLSYSMDGPLQHKRKRESAVK